MSDTAYITTPAFALNDETYYYVVTVEWEYTSARYVMPSDKPDAIRIDFTETILSWHRDEAFVIADVRAL